jgi:glucosamine-6-phosphate deaminase
MDDSVAGRALQPEAGAGFAVREFASRAEMGRAAARDIAATLRARLQRQAGARMMFAAAPSQAEVLAALVAEPEIDWRRVAAFHMDEYIGLPEGAPQRFARWLDAHLFDRVPFGAVHRIDPERFETPQACARAYADRLAEAPLDVVCLGIGVNGHLAFNDPPVADFHDREDVKVVALDAVCRQQQVDDDCFDSFDAVPVTAVTVTIPALMRGEALFCVVPGAAKREAVRRTLHDPIGEACPSTILRRHPRCTLYLDADSVPVDNR